MFTAILVAGVLSMSQGSARDEFTERSLCDLWAGAQCHASSCQEGAKERCLSESKKCRQQSRAVVPRDRASKIASCARAMLKDKCGAPAPSECSDVYGF
ncbi:MAG: hypothetical protein ACK4N5_04090 [Myxococcales bacterium]